MAIIDKIFGDPNARQLNKLEPVVEQINSLEKEFEKLSDEQLRAKTQEYKDRLSKGETLDDLLPEAFATVREASKRVIGMRHYDVQLLGGLVLNRGEITEMRTGEGKTLVATLPMYLNALEGKGAHLITVNDYLARRDTTWMGKIYHALGLSISCLQQQTISYIYDPAKTSEPGDEGSSKSAVDMEHLREISRKEAYAADITYGTNNEFGFDYLRDNMSQTLEGQTQRSLNYAIVDEVDSILIDEARTPLIISAPAQDSTDLYYTFAKIVPSLKEGTDYNVDEKMRAATLTEEGIHKVEKALGVENMYAEGGMRQVHHLEQALKAHTLFKKDKEYVVQENEVIIVDEFTGRMMYGRRYSDGLHQAIEAKENVKIQQESVTMATITFQNYFRMYKKLSGMTGTAKTEEEEFAKIYGLPVLVIPTNKPIKRDDNPDRIYKNEKGKYDAVVKEIQEKVAIGQPVLVGTVSIEKNEKFSALLKKAGVKYQMLNAKDHEREAQVIAQAGRPGSVTVATNMAGRGVDIVLGGDPPDADLAEAVKRLGGLHVIGTERHESRRIDNQLRGRSGRQGDPGSSVFFISTDDDLMRIFGSDRMKGVMEKLGVPDDMPIENNIISKSIESAQKKVEGHNFDTRKHLVEYDDVINKHREVIYGMRQKILESELENDVKEEVLKPETKQEEEKVVIKPRSLSSEIIEKKNATVDKPEESEETEIEAVKDDIEIKEANDDNPVKAQILDMVEQEVTDVINFHTQTENQEEWNMDEIYETIDTIFPVPLDVRFTMQEVEEKAGKDGQTLEGREALTKYLIKRSSIAYTEWEQSLLENEMNKTGIKFVQQVEKAVLLRSIDTLWVEHLDAMDHLRTGIGLRGYGQRDPLVEYKKESFRMFDSLRLNIRKQLVYSIYKVGQPIKAEQAQNLNFAGAVKTMAQGQGQFAGINATSPSAGGTTSGDMTAPRPAERLARKKEGVQDAPVTLSSSKGDKVGRNDPCPCGAINPETKKPYKYKKCGMINAPYHKV